MREDVILVEMEASFGFAYPTNITNITVKKVKNFQTIKVTRYNILKRFFRKEYVSLNNTR